MSMGAVFGLALLLGAPNGGQARHGLDRWTEGVIRHPLPEDARRQASAGACGPCGVALALKLAGREPPPLADLAQSLQVEHGRTSVHAVVQALRSSGFRHADAVRVVEPSVLADLPLPAIAYLHPAREGQEGHFVVLAAREDAHIQVIDYPRYVAWVELGRLGQFDEAWRGELVLLRPPPGAWTPWRAAAFGACCAWLTIGLALLGRSAWRAVSCRPGQAAARRQEEGRSGAQACRNSLAQTASASQRAR